MIVLVIVAKALFFGGGTQAQAAVEINFDTLTPGSYDLNFLAPYGIPNITIGGVTGPKGPLIMDVTPYEGFDAPSAPNIFLQNHESTYVSNNQGLNQPHWLEFEFSPELVSFSLTRIGFYPSRSMPRWQATFYDAEGVELGDFGETCGIGTDCYLYGDYPPKVFTFNAPPGKTIAKMRLTSWWYYCTFRNIGVDDFVLTLPDSDGDGFDDDLDNCPDAANPEQSNIDGDDMGDVCDICPSDANNECDGTGSNATPESCPMPDGQDVFVYEVVQAPAMGMDPSNAKPAGVGTAAEGGDELRLDVTLCEFDDAVDIYLGLHLPAIDPDHVYLIRSDGSIATIEDGGLVPWMENVQEEVDRSIFDNAIDISSIPDGVYYVYVLVTPHGTISSYYLWATYFLHTPTWPESTEMPDPDSYDEILEVFLGPSSEPLPPPPPTLDPELVVESANARDAFGKAADGEYADLRIVDAALEPVSSENSGSSCAPYLMQPTVTLENLGTIANGPDDMWMVKYSLWTVDDGGGWSSRPSGIVEQVGSIKAGSRYEKPPFVIEPGARSTWEATGFGVYSNLYPRTIRWDLYRASREFAGKWELKDTLFRSFDVPGPNLVPFSAEFFYRVEQQETQEKKHRATVHVWVKNIGDAGTETPVRVRVTVPIKDLDEQHNSSPSESFNQAFQWYFEFPPIPSNGEDVGRSWIKEYVELPPEAGEEDGGSEGYGKKGPDFENIYFSVWRDCEESPEGWDKDIRDNHQVKPAFRSASPAQ